MIYQQAGQPAVAKATHLLQESIQLSNGWWVPARSQVEARFIYKEIVEEQCYLQQGIHISQGATVMDVGANIGPFCVLPGWVPRGAHACCAGCEAA